MKTILTAIVAFPVLLAGCASLAGGTNMLSDERIASESAGALGYDPSRLTIVSRRTAGTNTYVVLKADDSREFNCIVNGGNLLTFGMVNPPACAPKGEPVRGAGLLR